MHQELLQRNALRNYRAENDGAPPDVALTEVALPGEERFTLDEVLQIVADRAVEVTGADGLAIALAENDEIVLRAGAGTVRPDSGARIDRASAFSGACIRTAQIVSCDDTETDARVNRQACRRLGTRSMVAVPICAQSRGIGLLQAFSAQPFGFSDGDVRNLNRLAELVMRAFTPEDEQHFKKVAEVAAKQLEEAPGEPEAAPIAEPGTLAGQRDRATRESAMLVLLVCIVIVSALAGRMWWKPKASQLAKKIVPTEKVASKPLGTTNDTPPSPSAGTATNHTSMNPGATHTQSHASNSRPKLQELLKLPMVTGIQHSSSADSSTVIFDLEDQVRYEAHRLGNPDRIYFDLHDTQLASNLAGKSVEVGDALLKRIRAAQPEPGTTRIVLETKPNIAFSASLESNPSRLIVELRKAGASSKGAR
jgi:putative methionine-R-sulfoxide reductase with GAF domain